MWHGSDGKEMLCMLCVSETAPQMYSLDRTAELWINWQEGVGHVRGWLGLGRRGALLICGALSIRKLGTKMFGAGSVSTWVAQGGCV